MRPGEPSRTAYGAARHRAVHQVLEGGRIFRDPLAWAILGADQDETVARARNQPRGLRLFIAVRHRFAEDGLAAAVARGVDQAVVLGAGLDTLGYRHHHAGLRVFEVDHPDTGAWKRERLREAGIDARDVVGVGVDFERDDLVERLAAHGFDVARPAYFLWLGVVPYLTRDAVRRTLQEVGALPGAEIVFDYPSPSEGLDDLSLAARRSLEDRVARAGEPLRTALTREEAVHLVRTCGFDEVEDLGRDEFLPRYLGVPATGRPGNGGGHVLHGRRTTWVSSRAPSAR